MNAQSSYVHRYDPPVGEDLRTLLVLHGTGGDENSLLPFGRFVAPEAGLLSVRGKENEGGALRFFQRFAEGVFDFEDIENRANEMAAFLKEASEAYGFDPDKVCAFGYSNGANMGWSTLLRHPEALAGGMFLRPMVTLPGEPETLLTGKQILVSAGKWDPIVPVENTERLAAQMRSLGADVELNWNDGGHEIGRPELMICREWFRRMK